MQKYQLLWEEDHIFEVDAPSTDEYPLGSISADELREKYVYNLRVGQLKVEMKGTGVTAQTAKHCAGLFEWFTLVAGGHMLTAIRLQVPKVLWHHRLPYVTLREGLPWGSLLTISQPT